ncbi:MAG: ATP-binding protein [Verrucomicrobia bacterium]|nr:ATP-binding protein [Verrucomicrobiota bacterium]
MKRKYLVFLQDWLESRNRHPLVIRGARQTGKTWLVRYFAKQQNKRLIELNLEKEPQFATFFKSNDPKQILLNLGAYLGEVVEPKKCLLFLDEIQAIPELLAKLRWFAEDLPELPVIAAGSLLEFVLEKHTFSMPVGRIGYMHMEPFSFEEFLVASNQEGLLDYLKAFEWNKEIPEALHNRLMSLVKEYVVIGGMPAAVETWIIDRSLPKVSQVHRNLITTYRDDFAKYSGRIDKERLDEILLAVPKFLGEKFIYSKVNPDVKSVVAKQALDLLCKARVCHRVTSAHANGIPLGAELDKKFFKSIFLDVGLCSAALGLTLDQITAVNEIALVNSGGVAEQIVGQFLRTINASYIEPELYYWLREGKNSAEIDYIIQQGSRIVPIEVKAGSTGSLKSLHLFMGLKKLSLAVRINSDFPSKTEVQVKDQNGDDVRYTLVSIPFYLVGQISRLI